VEAYFNTVGRTTADADYYFDKIDGDGDGNLTQIERKAFFLEPSLTTLDTGNSGSIDQSEFEAWYTGVGGTTAQADGVFNDMDANGDGTVTSSERSAYYNLAHTFPNPSEVVHANINMAGSGYIDQKSVALTPNNTVYNQTSSYSPMAHGYLGEGVSDNGTFDVSFNATATVTPMSAPTPDDYGVALNSVTVTPFVNYRVDLLSNPSGDKLSLFKQPMTAQWLGLDDIASLSPQALLDAVDSAIDGVSVYAEYFGRQQNAIDQMMEQTNKLSDTLTAGIGNLVDADMAKESATLQAQQVKQQLATQTLSIANQQPDWILDLFK
jgi:flagellin-like hook-associated protein FlgL